MREKRGRKLVEEIKGEKTEKRACQLVSCWLVRVNQVKQKVY